MNKVKSIIKKLNFALINGKSTSSKLIPSPTSNHPVPPSVVPKSTI